MEYFVKFSAILGLFYIVYKLFLEKETFFNAIRAYFLVAIAAAAILPLVVIPEYVYVDTIISNTVSTDTREVIPADTSSPFDLWNLIYVAYGTGVLFFGVRFLIQLGSLFRFIFRYSKKRKDGFVLIESSGSTSPFSFFKYIIYPKNGFNKDEKEQIIAHEKVHASQYHSFDILLTQLLIIFNWWNPVAWMLQKEIQKNLEFIADQGAQLKDNCQESYQYLLLKTVTPNYSFALTSNFYNSIIKKRIKMLHQNKSNKFMYIKFMFIIPLLFAFVFTFNTKVIAQQKKEKNVEWTSENKVKWKTKLEVEIITKDFQKSDLENLKSELLKDGITMNYKKLRYNDNNEIIGIQISLSNKQNNKTQIEQMGSAPIKPISIKFDDKGALAVGNLESMKDHNVFVTTNGDEIHKKVIVTTSGDMTKDEQSFVYVTEDGGTTHVKMVNGKKIIEEVHGGGDHNVWVTKEGDTTKIKKIKIIEIDEDTDSDKKVIIERIHEDDKEIEVKIIGDKHKSGTHAMFISEDGEKPLMIVDGKEIEGGSLKDIDSKNIETVEVLKGDKAVEKYGEKAKDGVVIIKTKK
ncbi:M56 family metallopeptidase [Lutimonas saemankumensis]|uniref:M56 family metallopeptidase n=1 Tax=Lutimonas saemankumensis TaxID=483016 RepID=UPI001CD7C74C|nr:M56 family metallopeptidase [Lutimonas saemankumensis]MCA0932424.1 M56 family metallopeptidase [Lutimonas saemankumensis]